MRRRAFIVAWLAIAALAGGGPAPAAPGGNVTVFAAASLKNALDAIAAKWRSETGGETTISYAASSTLAKQIENGAPADIFISADQQWMDYVASRKLIEPETRYDLLSNRLVLIAPQSSAAATTIAPGFPLAEMLGDGRLAMADPASVPAGIYGKAALTKLGVWASVEGRVAAAENVRAALLLVARGEAPLGVVYQTDAAVEPKVKIVASFPPDSVPPIVYPMALIKGAQQGAAVFAEYLRGPAARALFEAQGFVVLEQ